MCRTLLFYFLVFKLLDIRTTTLLALVVKVAELPLILEVRLQDGVRFRPLDPGELTTRFGRLPSETELRLRDFLHVAERGS